MPAPFAITSFTAFKNSPHDDDYLITLESIPMRAAAKEQDNNGDLWWPSKKTTVVLGAGEKVGTDGTITLSLEDGTQVVVARLPYYNAWIPISYVDEDGVQSDWAKPNTAGDAAWAAIQAKTEAKPSKKSVKSKSYVSKKTGKVVPAGAHIDEIPGKSMAAILIPLALVAGAAWYFTRPKKGKA